MVGGGSVIVCIREDDREGVHSTDVQTQKILPRHHSAFGIRLGIFGMDIFLPLTQCCEFEWNRMADGSGKDMEGLLMVLGIDLGGFMGLGEFSLMRGVRGEKG